MREVIKKGDDIRSIRKPINKLAESFPQAFWVENGTSTCDDGSISITVDRDEKQWIKLTSKLAGTPIKYAWKMVNHDRTTDTWTDALPTGDTVADWAEELNNADLAVGTDTRYLARLHPQSGRWIIETGGGGGSNTVTQSNPIIMLLGTYDDYKNCPGVPAKPPTITPGGTDFCAPPYAWSAYDVCNYKYVKKFDMRSFGHWATELNGGGASAFRRFYNAYYGNSTDSANLTLNSNIPTNCKGVRFLGFSSQASLVCVCPTWLSSVKCLKFTAKFVATLIDDPADTCPAQFYTDMAAYWGTTQTVTACQQSPGACSWAANIGPFTLSLIWQEIPITDGCNWGPDIFDPCNPCDGFGQLKLTMGKAKASGGNAANFYSGYNLSQGAVHGLILDCTTGPITVPFSIMYSSCPQVFESLTVQCCSAGEIAACP